MKILLLTTLFLVPLYYFTQDETAPSPHEESIDSIKVKMGAPKRSEIQRFIPVKPQKKIEENTPAIVSVEEEVPEVELNDLEDGWHTELKEMLMRLEPMDGEAIFSAYVSQNESYQSEFDHLQNEKQQKTSDEAILEIDQMIVQLDQSHQYKLKEILGAHYEAVRDHYEDFMDSQEEEY